MNANPIRLRLGLRSWTLSLAASAALVAACGGEEGPNGPGPNGEPSNVPGMPELWIDAGDGLDHGPLTTLTVGAGDVSIEQTLSQMITVEGTFQDGVTVRLDEMVTWETSNPGVVALGQPTADGVEAMAVAVGTSVIGAQIGSLRGERNVSVVPPTLIGLNIEVAEPVAIQQVGRLVARATYRDNSTKDVTAQTSWSASAPESILVLNDEGRKGLIYTRGRDPSTITATFEDQTATLDLTVPCTVQASNAIAFNRPMPNASWPGALVYDETSQALAPRALSIQDMLCESSFDNYRAFVFSVNAGWCGPCHAWMRMANSSRDQLEAAGILPVFVVADGPSRRTFSVATTEYADRLVTQHGNHPWAIRIGDVDTEGAGPTGIRQAVAVTQGSWPTLFIVRRSDMQVMSIAGGRPPNVNPLIQFVESNIGTGGGQTPMTNCPAGGDEASEPNDLPRLAPVIAEGFSGGICNEDGTDYFRVRQTGPWRVTIMFQNSSADLDLYAWDEANNRVATGPDNRPLASQSVRNDFESLDLQGEALIRVQAKSGTAPYTLLIDLL